MITTLQGRLFSVSKPGSISLSDIAKDESAGDAEADVRVLYTWLLELCDAAEELNKVRLLEPWSTNRPSTAGLYLLANVPESIPNLVRVEMVAGDLAITDAPAQCTPNRRVSDLDTDYRWFGPIPELKSHSAEVKS